MEKASVIISLKEYERLKKIEFDHGSNEPYLVMDTHGHEGTISQRRYYNPDEEIKKLAEINSTVYKSALFWEKEYNREINIPWYTRLWQKNIK